MKDPESKRCYTFEFEVSFLVVTPRFCAGSRQLCKDKKETIKEEKYRNCLLLRASEPKFPEVDYRGRI